MKKRCIILCTLLLAMLLTACGTPSRLTTFDGDRVSSDRTFLLDFTVLNTTDAHDLTLSAGDTLHVDASVESGSLRILIRQAEQAAIYEGNDTALPAAFDVAIEQGGVYTVTVTGQNAKGSVHFLAQAPADGAL